MDTMPEHHTPLYPPIQPSDSGFLDVGDGHSVYWEECGNPDGPAVIFLHGGPGAGCAPPHRRFFDPSYWRIVLFDQRGCGRSKPSGSIEANTTQHIIADIEAIRQHLKIEKWMPFGGSWGSLLALVYGIAHPDRCTGFIIRGIFLGEDEELRWFMEDMQRFFPRAGQAFMAALPEDERGDALHNYYKRLIDPDPAIHGPAARAWSNYESSCARLIPSELSDTGDDLPLSRIEAHYFVEKMFIEQGFVMNNLDKIAHLPCHIVQGRYDVICPPWTAQKLADALPNGTLTIVNDAGHSAFEPGIQSTLVQLMELSKQPY